MTQLLTYIATYFNINNAIAKIYCDNNEAIRHHPLDKATYTTMTKRDIDLKMEMNRIQAINPITFVFYDVEGHADNSSDFVYEEASQQVQRNIDMDALSKTFLKTIKTRPNLKMFMRSHPKNTPSSVWLAHYRRYQVPNPTVSLWPPVGTKNPSFPSNSP